MNESLDDSRKKICIHSNQVGPFSHLPVEIISLIFQHIKETKSLLSVELTCKKWGEAIIWFSLVSEFVPKLPNDGPISNQYLKRIFFQINKMDIHEIPPMCPCCETLNPDIDYELSLTSLIENERVGKTSFWECSTCKFKTQISVDECSKCEDLKNRNDLELCEDCDIFYCEHCFAMHQFRFTCDPCGKKVCERGYVGCSCCYFHYDVGGHKSCIEEEEENCEYKEKSEEEEECESKESSEEEECESKEKSEEEKECQSKEKSEEECGSVALEEDKAKPL